MRSLRAWRIPTSGQTSSSERNGVRPYLFALGAFFCWGSLPASTGSGLQGLRVPELLAFSFVPAALYLLLQHVLLNRSLRLHWPGWRVSLLGIYGLFGYHALYYLALDHAPLAEGAILTTTWSFWIVVFGSFLQHRRLKLGVVGGALLGLLGAGVVIGGGQELQLTSEYTLGYGMALGCGLLWGSFSVALSRLELPQDPMPLFTVQAALLSVIAYGLSGDFRMPDPSSLGAALYLGIVPLGLSFTFWHPALKAPNLALVGVLSYLTPPLAILLVGLVHGTAISPFVWGGMALILAASYLCRRFG